MTQGGDNTLMAAGLILTYAVIIGFTDNFVRVIAAESGLWQFHLLRGCIALGLIGLAALPMGLRMRPVHWRAVVARSSLIGIAMIIYFGALAFLPVAMVAAGLSRAVMLPSPWAGWQLATFTRSWVWRDWRQASRAAAPRTGSWASYRSGEPRSTAWATVSACSE